jgi:hypothetical protein
MATNRSEKRVASKHLSKNNWHERNEAEAYDVPAAGYTLRCIGRN